MKYLLPFLLIHIAAHLYGLLLGLFAFETIALFAFALSLFKAFENTPETDSEKDSKTLCD